MPKKKAAKKKSVTKMQKPEKIKERAKWILPVVIIFIVIAAILMALQMGIFGKRAGRFEEAVSMVNEIDRAHNISFSSYEKGIIYLESHPRYPNPFNFDEMDIMLKEYRSIAGDDAVKLFIDFRSFLVESEKYYRLSMVSSKADPHKYGMSCKNGPVLFDSINNTQRSISSIKSMLQSLNGLKENYSDEYNQLNISDKWVNLMNKTITDLRAEITFKKDYWGQFCGNFSNQSVSNNSMANITDMDNSTEVTS